MCVITVNDMTASTSAEVAVRTQTGTMPRRVVLALLALGAIVIAVVAGAMAGAMRAPMLDDYGRIIGDNPF